MIILMVSCLYCVKREITRKLTFPKQPTNPFLEMVKFLLERIAPVHIDSEAIRSENILTCSTDFKCYHMFPSKL